MENTSGKVVHEMLIIHAKLSVQPQHREAFLEETKKVVAGSVAEEGNISYHLYEDPEKPNSFILVEEWKDAAALKVHEQTPHFQAFMQGVKDLLAAPLDAGFFEAQPTRP